MARPTKEAIEMERLNIWISKISRMEASNIELMIKRENTKKTIIVNKGLHTEYHYGR